MALLTNIVLQSPFTRDKVSGLRIGESVTVSGLVYTARDRVNKYLFEGGKSPVELKDAALFHCGPIVIRRGDKWVVQNAGPTTSLRQEPYVARIIEEHRIRLIIGKGGMGESTRKACAKYGCVYLQAVGGASAVIAKAVESVKGVHFLKEFGAADALWELDIRNFETVVAIDAEGRSLFKRIELASKSALADILD